MQSKSVIHQLKHKTSLGKAVIIVASNPVITAPLRDTAI